MTTAAVTPLFRSNSTFSTMKDKNLKSKSHMEIEISSPGILTINSMPCSPLNIYSNDSQDSQDSESSSDYCSAKSSPSLTPYELEQQDYFSNLDFTSEQLKALHRWCFAFCVVRFDLETGQALDKIVPDFPLSDSEKNNLSFSAFPDTRVFESGDMVYQFRIRNNSTDADIKNDGFYYCYTYFKQKKDSRIRRGYYQKSLVLITPLPFSTTVGLFTSIIRTVGSKYFELDYKQTDSNSPNRTADIYLDSVLRNIAQWPDFEFSKSLELPLSGKVLRVETPDSNKPSLQLLETSQLSTNSSEVSGQAEMDIPIMASVPDIGAPGLLFHWWDKLEELWSIWELMLLGEPLVVMGPDPSTCSQVITELLDLIKPIPYCGDYRPYITIQDPDFKSFASKNRVPPNTIIGVTNPHFSDALAHWPHWIQVGTGQPAVSNGSKRHRHRVNHSNPFAAFNTNSRSTTPNGGLKQGIYTSRKSCLIHDSAAIRNLTSALLQGDRSATVLNNRLRRYFGELTQKFLLPLNRYMTTLYPSQISWSLNSSVPIMNPFKPDDFLKYLTSQTKTVFGTSKSDWNIELYKQFLKSGNFATWLHQTLESCELQLKLRYIQHLCTVNIQEWVKNKQEIEIVDVIMKLKDRLREIENSNYFNTSNDTCIKQLKSQLECLVSYLPNDLQGFL